VPLVYAIEDVFEHSRQLKCTFWWLGVALGYLALLFGVND
jgi:hypothetical protein